MAPDVPCRAAVRRPEPHHDHITHRAAVQGREIGADDGTESVQVCVHHNRHVDIYVYRLVPDREGALRQP